MKLYGSTTSPYVRKVRLVALEKKIDLEFILDHNQMPDYQAGRLNPLGKVPLLQLDENTVIFDSPVIAEYIDNLSPNRKLIPNTSRERMMVKRWEALCDGICDAAIMIVMENRREKFKIEPAVIAAQTQKIENGLAFCAKELGKHEYCFGNQITLADLALITMLDYLAFRMPQIDWRNAYPQLSHYHQRLSVLPHIQETIPQ